MPAVDLSFNGCMLLCVIKSHRKKSPKSSLGSINITKIKIYRTNYMLGCSASKKITTRDLKRAISLIHPFILSRWRLAITASPATAGVLLGPIASTRHRLRDRVMTLTLCCSRRRRRSLNIKCQLSPNCHPDCKNKSQVLHRPWRWQLIPKRSIPKGRRMRVGVFLGTMPKRH